MRQDETEKLICGELTEKVIGAAIEVHRELGSGLLESAYEECLEHELQLQGLAVRRQVLMPLIYKGLKVENAYRIDLLVANSIVIELKAVEQILPVHEAQLMTYLRLSRKRVGLLMNFHAPVLKDGLKRLVL